MENVLSTELITLTNSAIQEINKILLKENNNVKLRISIISGGCNGFKYYFYLDDLINDNDIIIERLGAKLIIDNKSFQYIKGGSIDYLNTLEVSKFIIYNNPNIKYQCSCGYSFSI